MRRNCLVFGGSGAIGSAIVDESEPALSFPADMLLFIDDSESPDNTAFADVFAKLKASDELATVLDTLNVADLSDLSLVELDAQSHGVPSLVFINLQRFTLTKFGLELKAYNGVADVKAIADFVAATRNEWNGLLVACYVSLQLNPYVT